MHMREIWSYCPYTRLQTTNVKLCCMEWLYWRVAIKLCTCIFRLLMCVDKICIWWYMCNFIHWILKVYFMFIRWTRVCLQSCQLKLLWDPEWSWCLSCFSWGGQWLQQTVLWGGAASPSVTDSSTSLKESKYSKSVEYFICTGHYYICTSNDQDSSVERKGVLKYNLFDQKTLFQNT